MRAKNLFGMKNLGRVVAFALAGVMAFGGIAPMRAQATDGATGVLYPQYIGGVYQYNAGDIFGAATHVHLFGNKVTTSAHTHGNIMAEKADLSEIGMRTGKISYPSDYKEVSYIGSEVIGAGSDINGDMILGDGIEFEPSTGEVVTTNNGTVNLDMYVKGAIHQEAAGTNAVEIATTLAKLEGISTNWAGQVQTPGVSWDLTSDQNKRIINTNQTTIGTNQNIFINIPYADWHATTNYIRITGLDSNTANKGIVVINIDLKDATSDDDIIRLTSGDMKVQDSEGNTYNNTEHGTAAFGGCRIVYNIIDSSAPNSIFRGEVEFMGTIFGTILAPGAKVTVGAINGNVMADEIVHANQESHRLDVWPVFTQTYTKVENEEIRLLLDVIGLPKPTGNDAAGTESGTTYTLYTDAAGTNPAVAGDPAFNEIKAVWNVTEQKYEVIISSSEVTEHLSEGTYWLEKVDITNTYEDNNVIFQIVIEEDGTIKYAEATSSGTLTSEPKHAILTDVLVKDNDKVELDVVLEGQEAPAADTKSDVTYTIYKDENCNTPVTGMPEINADFNTTEGNYEVVFDKADTADLEKGKEYYIGKVSNTSGYTEKDGVNDPYKFRVNEDGSIEYYDKTGTSWSTNIPKEVLVIPNDKVELDVVLEGQAAPAGGTGSKVVYTIYKDEACNTPVTGMPEINADFNTTEGNYEVVFDKADTATLEKGETYYIGKVSNASGYTEKDGVNDPFKFRVNADGSIEYFTKDNTWTAEVQEDVLVKSVIVIDKVELDVVLEGQVAPTEGAKSEVTYTIYTDAACNNPVTGMPQINAGFNEEEGNYEVVFDKADTAGLETGKEYYIGKVENESGYTEKDGVDDPYKFRVNADGSIEYLTKDNTWTTAVQEEVLIKKEVPNDKVELDVVLEGQEVPVAGTESDVVYTIYTDEECKVVAPHVPEINAEFNTSEGNYEVVFDKEDTATLVKGEEYYIGKVTNTSGYTEKDGVNDPFKFRVNADGSIEYFTKDLTWTAEVQKEVLVKELSGGGPGIPQPENEKIELNVQFNGPAVSEEVGTNSGVKYEVYEDADCKTPVAGTETEATYNDDKKCWEVVIDKETTKDLDQEKVYYIGISNNGSGYKDQTETVFQVKFDTEGKPSYSDEGANETPVWEKGPLEDLLIKNDDIELNVELEGETTPSQSSKVTYEVYADKELTQKVDGTKVEATYDEDKKLYEVVIDADKTIDMERGKDYYITRVENNSDYVDKDTTDTFKVRFDENGNVEYFDEVTNNWQDDVLSDVLVKGTSTEVKPEEPKPEPPKTEESQPEESQPEEDNDDSYEEPAPDTTDKSNTGSTTASTPVNTGSNSLTSAATGEVQTLYIFVGFASILVISAALYFVIKAKRSSN